MTRTSPPAVPPGALSDRYGRIARDLRVSVTDRCNLRCSYCMPAEGLPWLAKPEMLSDDELVRLIGIFVDLGVRQIRFTGGEPLLRRSVVELVQRVAALEAPLHLAMTTNAIGLQRLAQPLADAGLHRVNVSLDTVDPQTFAELTRRDRFADVERGLAAAAAAGLTPVKVNAVAMRGINDDDVAHLLQWCLDRGYELRFIEHMPLDAQHAWKRSEMVTAAEIRQRLSERFSLTPLEEAERGSAPAQRFLVDGGPATVGIIASVTAPFCGACDRVRLTADGQLRNCLFARAEGDLRALLRSGADDAQIAAAVIGEVGRKRAGHGIDDPAFVQPSRPMSAIGG